MASDNPKNVTLENNDIFSDEEITSYQVPHSSSNLKKILCTPVSPPLCILPPSLQSSLRTKSLRQCASESKCSKKIESNIKQWSASTIVQSSAFQSLGMNDKDISWVSSMESLVADGSPRLEFNTIERATFLPCEKKINQTQIQRRALFPTTSEDSLGFQPLDNSLTSDDEKSYTRALRLSDVCDILKTLDVESHTSNEVIDPNCYDFDVAYTLPCSPSLFSPQIHNDSFFSKESSPVIRQLPKTENINKKIPAASFASTPHFKSNLNLSPCIFSPNRISPPLQLGKSKLPPIEKSPSLEGSVLEIPLEETPNFKSQVKWTENQRTNIENKASAAKCLKFPHEQKDEQIENKPITTIADVGGVSKNKFRTKKSKQLFGSSKNVTLFEASDIDDILKTLEENENASSQFFSCIVKNKKALPNADNIMSFNDYFHSKENGSIENISLKRQAELDIPKSAKKAKTNFAETKFCLPGKREMQISSNPVKLEKSAWNSKNKHLIDSQGDVTDTQIFQICEEVESKIAKNNQANLKCLLPQKKGLGSRRNKKCWFSTKNTTKTDFNAFRNEVEEKDYNAFTECKKEPMTDQNLDLRGASAAQVDKLRCDKVGLYQDKVRNMFNDENESCIIQGLNNEILYLSSQENKSLVKSKAEKSLSDVVNCSIHDKEKTMPDTLIGFHSENGQAKKLPMSSIDRVKNLFDNLVDFEKTELDSNMIKSKHRFKIPDVSYKLNTDLVEAPFIGFRTGNNSLVNPSKSSINKIRNIFDACDLEEGINDVGPETSSSVGFPTEDKSFIKPSESSISKVRQKLSDWKSDLHYLQCKSETPILEHRQFKKFTELNQNTDLTCSEIKFDKSDCVTNVAGSLKTNEPIKQFLGFQTGNNQVVKPSTASLAKVKNIFENMDSDNLDKDIQRNFPNFESSFNTLDTCNGGVEAPVGFKTGNNKFIKPSSNSLAKVKKIFENLDSDNLDIPEESTNFEQLPNANKIDVDNKTDNNEFVKPSVKYIEAFDKNIDNNMKFTGFCTGNKKLIKPSDAALSKVKNIFDNIDDLDENKTKPVSTDDCPKFKIANKPQNSIKFEGFCAGNKSLIRPSDAALAKVKNIFENIDELDENKTKQDRTNDCPNFQISNKPQNSIKFEGFCTGNKNFIRPSDAAWAKVKNIFENIDEIAKNHTTDSRNDDYLNSSIPQDGGKFGGFCTGNKNVIIPSETALEKVRKMFKDDCQNESSNLKDVTVAKNAETSEIELKNDKIVKSSENAKNEKEHHVTMLDESYSTLLENTDWDDNIIPAWLHISPVKNESASFTLIQPATKRHASSDISLPCKRRKGDINESLKKRQDARIEQSLGGKNKGKVKPQRGSYILRKDLMLWQDMLYKGPDRVQYDDLKALGVEQDVIDITADNSKDYRFKAERYFCEFERNKDVFELEDGFKLIFDDANTAGVEEFESAFLAGPGVDPGLVPVGWITHHYGLIVWKLACYQRTCFKHFSQLPLTPNNVMLQIKYRYDREIDLSESSALKRILERDDAAGKPLVLTVMRVCKLVEGYELMLTDGWYTCPARTDCALEKAIIAGKLKVGTKLMTQGAELVGCEQGAPPLERPLDVYLKISTNSTRRVRWYHKLGFQKLRYPPYLSLKSILPSGGGISCIRVAVVRVYPIVYVEKKKDGTRVTRNSKAEAKAASLFLQEQELRMEKLYSQVQKEMSAKSLSNVPRVTRFSLNSISNLSAEELCNILENSPDPASVEAMLSDEQKSSLWKYQESRRFNAGKELQQKMEAEKMHKRDVRSVLRLRLVELNGPSDFSALLSWWQPAEDLLSIFVEGKALALFNLSPGNTSSLNQIYLNSARGTRIEQLPTPSSTLPMRNILRVDNICSDFTPVLGEIDVVGLVVYIHSVTQGTLTMQTVYLTDTGQSYFGLVFWRGLQEFSCEDTLAEGLVISANNMQWRRTSSSGAILCGYATEFSLFTQKSKSPLIQTVIDLVKEEFEEEDIPTFIEKCQDDICTRLHSFKNLPANQSNLSNTSVGNISGLNGNPGYSSVDVSLPNNASPHPRPRYLNGFAQTPKASSTPVKTKTPAQKRIEKLQLFGEPPPLSPIPTYQASKSCKAFRLPLSKSTSLPR